MPQTSLNGLRRKYPTLIHCDLDEDEYWARISFDAGLHKQEWARNIMFKKGWRTHLEKLRLKQANTSKKFRRIKKLKS